jgi:hypothetical protein
MHTRFQFALTTKNTIPDLTRGSLSLLESNPANYTESNETPANLDIKNRATPKICNYFADGINIVLCQYVSISISMPLGGIVK